MAGRNGPEQRAGASQGFFSGDQLYFAGFDLGDAAANFADLGALDGRVNFPRQADNNALRQVGTGSRWKGQGLGVNLFHFGRHGEKLGKGGP